MATNKILSLVKIYCSIAILSLSVILASCQKEGAKDDNCAKIKQVKIVADTTVFTVGDEIKLQVNEMPDIALYKWTLGSNSNVLSYDEYHTVHYAEKKHEGWYYLSVSNPDCETHVDSIYITVKNNATAAPCTPANNTVTFSSIPDINPATVGWSYNTSWNRRLLFARGAYGYPDFSIYFNTHWDSIEPEDGEYTVTGMLETNEYPPYTVYISSLYSGVLFQAGSGSIFVSHVNGKIRATFCGVSLTGSNGGPSFKTTASGMLTAP